MGHWRPARAGPPNSGRRRGFPALASSYSPRLPGLIAQWLRCGFRLRLRLRGSAGFTPASLIGAVETTKTISGKHAREKGKSQ